MQLVFGYIVTCFFRKIYSPKGEMFDFPKVFLAFLEKSGAFWKKLHETGRDVRMGLKRETE